MVNLLFGVGDLLSGLLIGASFVRVFARIFFKVKEMSGFFCFSLGGAEWGVVSDTDAFMRFVQQ